MSHTIIIVQNGTGTGGSATGRIEYTPDHSVPGAKQIRKAERAAEMLEKINDMLYGPDTEE
jgi:hypothetical protein